MYDGVARLLAKDPGRDIAAVKRLMNRHGKPRR
jgi:hypothetical protein